MTQVNYREASNTDRPDLLKLEQKIVAAERPFDRFIKEKDAVYYDLDDLISDSNSCLMVAESAAKLVGSGYAQIREAKSCYKHDRLCYLGFIFVEEHFRGQGVARAIIDRLTDWGTSNEIQNFHLDVYTANESAIRTYEKAGFSKMSVQMVRVV